MKKESEDKSVVKEWNENLPAVQVPVLQKKPKKKRPLKKRGAKKIKRKFEETSIGNSLRLNAPLEYYLILNAEGGEPSADLIEAVGYASVNPYFKSTRFRRLLIRYRQNGCFQSSPVKPPDADALRRSMKVRKSRIRTML